MSTLYWIATGEPTCGVTPLVDHIASTMSRSSSKRGFDAVLASPHAGAVDAHRADFDRFVLDDGVMIVRRAE